MRARTSLPESVPVGNWWDKLDLVRSIYCPTATNTEFELYKYIARRYNLDPFLKQIHFVPFRKFNKKKGKYVRTPQIFAGRDGFIAKAHESGQFDGLESDAIYDEDDNLIGAWAKVWRKGCSHPFCAKVKFSEYYHDTDVWNSKQETMIVKVAEVQALRKAFVISGLYAPEEFGIYEEDGNLNLPVEATSSKNESVPFKFPKAYTKGKEREKERRKVVQADTREVSEDDWFSGSDKSNESQDKLAGETVEGVMSDVIKDTLVKVQEEKPVEIVLRVIEDLQSKSEDGSADWEDIVKTAKDKHKIFQEKLEELVEKLLEEGLIYEPTLGKIKKI